MFIKPHRNQSSLLAVFVIALTFALPISLTFAPDAQGQSAEEIIKQANKLFDAKNYKEAALLYRKAAEQGHAGAQSMLGAMYNEGKGVLEDYEKAAEWFRKAAEQGDAGALSNLATMYGQGHGVKQDIPTAYALFLLSVKQGREQAREIVDELKEILTNEQITAGQKIAKEWEQRIERNR